MELRVYERLILMNVLSPMEGTLTTMRIVRDLKDRLGFTEAEYHALEFSESDGRVVWKTEADVPVEIEIGEKAKDIIKRRLETLSREGRLTLEHLPICERFGVEGD